MLNRMGTGCTRAELARLRAAGGPMAWFSRQLSPGSIAEDPLAAQVDGWFPDLTRSFTQIWSDDRTGTKQAWEYGRDLANRSLLRRIHSRRGLLENMVDFWSNHLHVSSEHFPAFAHRPSYDALIRRHALGSFETLLTEATLHPAMVLYLDTWLSERDHPNENHGRELLELHTVGRTAGYTEAMVKDSARILSGHTVRSGWSGSATDPWAPYYDPGKHALGSVTVLGFRHANDDPDGRAGGAGLPVLPGPPPLDRPPDRPQAVRALRRRRPARGAGRLRGAGLPRQRDEHHGHAARPGALGDLPGIGRPQGHHPLRRPRPHRAGARDPARRPRVAPRTPTPTRLAWTLGSTLPFQWPRPDGSPDDAGSWGSATRMLNSWRMHWDAAGGWWPSQAVTYRSPASWLPQRSIRFDLLVDHLCRLLLGRRSSATLLQAASVATDVGLSETITASHPLVAWKMPRLLLVLLDSPDHMSR